MSSRIGPVGNTPPGADASLLPGTGLGGLGGHAVALDTTAQGFDAGGGGRSGRGGGGGILLICRSEERL